MKINLKILSFNPMFFDDVRNKFVSACCIVTSNVLTVTDENNKRSISPILPVNFPLSYILVHIVRLKGHIHSGFFMDSLHIWLWYSTIMKLIFLTLVGLSPPLAPHVYHIFWQYGQLCLKRKKWLKFNHTKQ